MSFDDPFTGYSALLRAIVYVAVPAFSIWQFVRLRRALHVFQLEGYKRIRFLDWCRADRRRALFLQRAAAKKPLVMTGRAWRILVLAETFSVLAVLVLPGTAHLAGGWPYDVGTWTVMTILVFFGVPQILAGADVLLTPVQKTINRGYLSRAEEALARIDPIVIGVTGSFGKTSTKFAIAGLLGSPEQALATPGSYNTPLGISRTINESLEPRHRFLVIEMGAYGPGEIAELCAIVHPRIGVLTAIGPAHLERYGTMDAIRRTKYEIVEALPRDGVAVMNVDDVEVRALADRTERVRVVRYGLDQYGRPDVTASDVRIEATGTALTIEVPQRGESLRVRTRLLGRHALGHVLAAVAVASAAGRDLEELGPAIEDLRPVEHRLQILEGTGGITVVDDAYNSNPEGAAAALEVLAAMPGGRKVVVTPGIVELGEMQREANETLGSRAAHAADVLIVVARVNRDAIVAGARRGGDEVDVHTVDTLQAAQEVLKGLLAPGDVVLFENDLPDQYEG